MGLVSLVLLVIIGEALASVLNTTTTATATPTNITGYIYCDNYFEFYFNGQLIKKDPMTFTPHQAVAVSFEYDGVSDKEYAIMCQDFATPSGYEYTEGTRTGLGDGAFLAEFSDGTVTSSEWQAYVVGYGPTEESEADGCAADNLGPCKTTSEAVPDDWTTAPATGTLWGSSTEYTEAEAGWGRTPTWTGGECCTATSPLTANDIGCSANYELDTGFVVPATVLESECLDPKAVLSTATATFLWGANLKKDNKILFRLSVPASADTPTAAPSATASSTATVSTTSVTAIAAVISLAAMLL